MSLVKTDTLDGAALDWAVGFARSLAATDGKPVLARDLMAKAMKNGMASPSTDWAQGGPLIERHDIWVRPFTAHMSPESEHLRVDENKRIMASLRCPVQKMNFSAFGPTYLIAAMRCYLLGALGKEIEVPGSLVPAQ